jgi:hypothetical protein
MRPLRLTLVSLMAFAAVTIPVGSAEAFERSAEAPLPPGVARAAVLQGTFGGSGVFVFGSGSLTTVGGTGTWTLTGRLIQHPVNIGPEPAAFTGRMTISFPGDKTATYKIVGFLPNVPPTYPVVVTGTGVTRGLVVSAVFHHQPIGTPSVVGVAVWSPPVR